MSLSIIDKDKDWRALKIVIKQMKKAVIKVGIQANAGNNEDGVSIVEYGTYQEYGTYTKKATYKKHSTLPGYVRIPARSFIRSTTDENDGWKKEIDAAYDSILHQNALGRISTVDVRASLELIGKKAREDIVAKINVGDPSWPPLAEETKKKKKSTKPLIDTGFLKRAIQYQVTYEHGNK